MKEAFTVHAPVLNRLCPTCSETCKQPPQVVVDGCKYYRAVKQRDTPIQECPVDALRCL